MPGFYIGAINQIVIVACELMCSNQRTKGWRNIYSWLQLSNAESTYLTKQKLSVAIDYCYDCSRYSWDYLGEGLTRQITLNRREFAQSETNSQGSFGWSLSPIFIYESRPLVSYMTMGSLSPSEVCDRRCGIAVIKGWHVLHSSTRILEVPRDVQCEWQPSPRTSSIGIKRIHKATSPGWHHGRFVGDIIAVWYSMEACFKVEYDLWNFERVFDKHETLLLQYCTSQKGMEQWAVQR